MIMAAVQGKDDDLREQVRMGADPRAYKDVALQAAAGKRLYLHGFTAA